MKIKIFVFFCLISFILVGTAFSQTINWLNRNQATIAWDAVTKLENGNNVPSGDVIKYTIFVKNQIGTIATINSVPITATQITITFTQEGKYLVGAKSSRYDSGGNLLTDGDVVWSDTVSVVADITGDGIGDPFGFMFYVKPKAVGNLRNVP